ncbi:YARHG domain-containing protein [Bacillus sp. REN10]|uniref:YARHG domain-containing protein n=1 Tax=Bacillus sp. REN10 TaxID=2782541 RepID=UPI00193BA1DE|nr:YARHG domain-containing protein [Bacillus sp. REN10]
MKICKACGHQSQQDHAFCSECGASLKEQTGKLTNREEVKFSKRKFQKNKLLIAFTLAAVLMIFLFTSYQMLSKKYSEEAVIDQFITALTQKDKQTLKTLIIPTDSRLNINEESLNALFALIDKEPSLIEDVKDSLHDEGFGKQPFYLRENGKHFGIFTNYVIDTPGYFIKVGSTGDNTTIHLNDSEIGVLDNAEDTKEFGPFLTGLYSIKGLSGKKKDEVTINLAGSKTETAVVLTTGTLEKEEEQKTIVKEVIREVTPEYSYYILPHSDYTYLTYNDIAGLTKSELRLARNEIFARHGYMFKSKDLQNYFNNQSWYSPNPNFNGNLSSLEKQNVEFIKSYE